jgi:hypothetical protein
MKYHYRIHEYLNNFKYHLGSEIVLWVSYQITDILWKNRQHVEDQTYVKIITPIRNAAKKS